MHNPSEKTDPTAHKNQGDKPALRLVLRKARDDIAVDQQELLSAVICEHALTAMPEVAHMVVALYAAKGSEVRTEPLHNLLRARGVVCCYPRVNTTQSTLEFIRVDNVRDLQTGPFAILEPRIGKAYALSAIHVVVVPGLAFDRQGRRLGYGRGYYDRSLVSFTGMTIGLAYRQQLVSSLPSMPHDILINKVITE